MNKILFLLLIFSISISCKPIDVQTTFNKGSSRATAYHDSDKMVNTKDYLFVTYLIHEEGAELVLIKRYNKSKQKWDQSNIIGKAKDDHGGGALVIDSQGYLHIVYGSHNSPLFYKKSQSTYDINSWSKALEIKGNLTYPSLVISKNDELFLAARSDVRNSSWSIRLFKKSSQSNSWNKGSDVMNSDFLMWKNSHGKSSMSVSNGYVRFGKYLSLNDKNELHLTFHYFEYVPKNIKTFSNNRVNSSTHFVAHTFSKDLGNSWFDKNGKYESQPLSLKNVTIISGNNDPSQVSCNYSAGQHFYKNDKLYFFFSKHYGIKTTLHLSSSSFPYNNWEEIEILNKDYHLRAPVTVSQGKQTLFTVNAIPKNIYVNGRPPANLPSKSKIIIGELDVTTLSLKWNDLNTMVNPSWLPQLSNEFDDVWFMVTQGARESNDTKVIINKVK